MECGRGALGCCLKFSLLSSKKGSGWGADGKRIGERKGSGVRSERGAEWGAAATNN